MHRKQFFITMVILLAAATTLLGQEEDLFYDTVDVRVVNLEVLVTDKAGKPVTGLHEEDFEVFEDGQPVELSNFFEVRDRQTLIAAQDRQTGQKDEGDQIRRPETRRLNLVIFVDNLNMRPENRNLILKDLGVWVDTKMGPDDQVMIAVLNDSVEVLQPFTHDPALVHRAMDQLETQGGRLIQLEADLRRTLRELHGASLSGNPALNGGAGGGLAIPEPGRAFQGDMLIAERLANEMRIHADKRMLRVKGTIQVLKRFTDSLAGMKGRKALLYMSDGLPVRPAESLAQAWINKYEDWVFIEEAADVRDEVHDMNRLASDSRWDATREIDEMASHAAVNRVTFYPISNGGRLLRSSSTAEFAGAGTTTGHGAFSQNVITQESLSLDASLLKLAQGTGGVAFTRSTNIRGLMAQVREDFSSFYSLGYQPIWQVDGKFRKLEVRVKNKDWKVRYFEGFREKLPLVGLQDLTLSALEVGLERNALEVELTRNEMGTVRKVKGKVYTLPLMVKIPVSKLLLLPEETYHIGYVTLYVSVKDKKSGGVSDFHRVDLPIKIPNEQIARALSQIAAYPLELELKKGHKRIAVGARDHLARTDATATIEVSVPDDMAVGESPATVGDSP